MGNIHFSITHYFPNPLSSSCPWLVVQVSSYVVGSCSVLLMYLSLAPTRFTVMADVQTVSVRPTVPPHVLEVFTIHPLGICLALPIHWQSGPLACWICQVNAATVLVRSAMVFHFNIIVSLSYAVAVARLMRVLCVPSISFMLFAPWYHPARVDYFCFFLYFRCAAWKCTQVFLSRCLSSHMSQSS